MKYDVRVTLLVHVEAESPTDAELRAEDILTGGITDGCEATIRINRAEAA